MWCVESYIVAQVGHTKVETGWDGQDQPERCTLAISSAGSHCVEKEKERERERKTYLVVYMLGIVIKLIEYLESIQHQIAIVVVVLEI